MKARRIGILITGAAVAAAAYFFWPQWTALLATSEPKAAAKRDEGKARSAPAPVTAAAVVERDMPIILKAPGTVEPLANVAVRPRVDGQIVEVAFREG